MQNYAQILRNNARLIYTFYKEVRSVLQAFDTLLQVSVTAELAGKNRIDEPFRYECLCCGEEVYVAAANSTMKVAHFRHRRGNSDRDCDLYLGRTGIAGALNAAKKRTHSRTEIYYDIKQQVFYVAVSFPEEKLQEFEGKHCVLEFCSSYNSQPFESIRVNRQNFVPDSAVQFPLRLTTNHCYITISGANYYSHYEILSDCDFPTFFKIPSSENSVNRAKRVVGGKVYTNTSYYIIAKNQEVIQKIENYKPDISVSQIDEIHALGTTIYGATLEILSTNTDLIGLFSYFNYDLETAEKVIQMWPPMYFADGIIGVNEKKVYLQSTFELVPHSNISCEDDKITQFDGLFEVDISCPVRIHRDNVDMHIEQCKRSLLQVNELCEQVCATKVQVTESSNFYLISCDGYRELPIGKFFLTNTSKIVKYKSNYPVVVFSYPEYSPKSQVAILRDILTYYKATISFDEQLITGCSLSPVAQIYIEECRITKVINTKALAFIKAGMV